MWLDRPQCIILTTKSSHYTELHTPEYVLQVHKMLINNNYCIRSI